MAVRYGTRGVIGVGVETPLADTWALRLEGLYLDFDGKTHFVNSYERASTVLTSNKGFEEWGQILGDEVMAAALIDRLLHHCHIVNIRGSSYRMRKHTDLSKILHSPPAESSPSPPKRKRARAKEKTTN